MPTADARQARLRRIMRNHKLAPKDVGALVDRDPSTVRAWRCGLYPIPSNTLELLELKVARPRPQSSETVATA